MSRHVSHVLVEVLDEAQPGGGQADGGVGLRLLLMLRLGGQQVRQRVATLVADQAGRNGVPAIAIVCARRGVVESNAGADLLVLKFDQPLLEPAEKPVGKLGGLEVEPVWALLSHLGRQQARLASDVGLREFAACGARDASEVA